MPKFSFNGKVTVGAFIEIEADSLEEARSIAEDRACDGELSFNGSGNEGEETWLVAEVDGEVFDITSES